MHNTEMNQFVNGRVTHYRMTNYTFLQIWNFISSCNETLASDWEWVKSKQSLTVKRKTNS